jgi:hypothetical protein
LVGWTRSVKVTADFASPRIIALVMTTGFAMGSRAEPAGGFVGRTWVLERIACWLARSGGTRYLLILGAPGTGKSAIAAHVARTTPAAAAHFCIARHAVTSDPNLFVQSIAQQLAKQEAFTQQAIVEPRILIQGEAKADQIFGTAIGVKIDTLLLGPETAQTEFNRAVGAPLTRMGREGHLASVLIVVDGLDEAVEVTAAESIVNLLATARGLPSFVRFLLFSRPEPIVVRHFDASDVERLRLEERPEDNLNDARTVVQGRLSAVGIQLSTDDKRIDRIVRAADGNFLVLDWIVRNVVERGLDLFSPPEAAAIGHFEGSDVERLLPQKRLEDSLDNARTVVHGRLTAAGLHLSKDDARIDQIARAAEYSFPVLDEILRDVVQRGFDTLTNRPPDLDALDAVYLEFLRTRRRIGQQDRWRSAVRPLLNLLVVAQAPLTKEQLHSISGLQVDDVRDAYNDLTQFLDPAQARKGLAVLFHKSIADFFTRDAAGEFQLDAAAAHARIAKHYLTAHSSDWRSCDAYGRAFTATHLAGAGAQTELRSLLVHPNFLDARLLSDGRVTVYQILRDFERLESPAPETALLQRLIRLNARHIAAEPQNALPQLAADLRGAGPEADALIPSFDAALARSHRRFPAMARINRCTRPPSDMFTTLRAHENPIVSLAFVRAGDVLVTHAASALHSPTGAPHWANGEVAAWDSHSGEPLWRRPNVTAMAVSSAGALVLASDDNTLQTIDPETWTVIRSVTIPREVCRVALSRGERLVACSLWDSSIRVLQLPDGGEVAVFDSNVKLGAGRRAHGERICFAYSGLLATMPAHSLDKVVVWDPIRGERQEYRGEADLDWASIGGQCEPCVSSIAVAGDSLAFVDIIREGLGSRIHRINLASGAKSETTIHPGPVGALALSQDGSQLAFGRRDSLVQLLRLDTRRAYLLSPAPQGVGIRFQLSSQRPAVTELA